MAKLLDVILLMRSHEIALSPDFSSCLIKAIEVSTLVGDKFKGFRELHIIKLKKLFLIKQIIIPDTRCSFLSPRY